MARVAIVDDSRMARAFVRATLEAAGHEVAEVIPTEVPAVVAALQAWRPDLVILDQAMPGCEGPSLVRACFEAEGLVEVPLLLLTAQRDPELAVRMRKLGVQEVMHKPVSASGLLAGVAALIQS